MLVAKGEGKLLECLGKNWHCEGKYWCKYLTVVDTLFTYTKTHKLNKKEVPFNIIHNNTFR
jgi:hypothetical protein